jgi:hypothetical protein
MTELETALRTAVAVAAFFDRDFNNFRDESLGQVTDFRMNRYRRSERTTTTYDHHLVTMLLDFGGATNRFENFQRRLHTTLQTCTLSGLRIRCERAPDFAQDFLDLGRLQPSLQHSDELIQ